MSLFPFLYFLFLCFVIQLTQLLTKHITSFCIVVAWGFVYKGLCLTCNNDNKFTPSQKFKSRLVLESLELSTCQVKSRKSSHAYHHAVTCDSHIHMSHSFSYLSSLPLITDPIAVASNNCAKDRCMQALGRNTLSKPHNWLPQRGTALSW